MELDRLSAIIDNEMHTETSQFPFDIFPTEVQQLIDNAHKTKGFNKEFLSAGILSICATAIGNTVNLYNGSYTAKPIFWITIIGRRGTGKTQPLEFTKTPIEQRDTLSFEDYKQAYNEYEKNEGKGKRPKYSKFILKDFTPEKLAETLQYNEKGVLIFQDELMRWINSFDQYKKGGDQQMYLDLFNGSGLTVDRVTKEPIRIEHTNVNILGGMQPEILKSIAKNNRNEDGFLDRFLFVYPDNIEPNLFTGLDIDQRHLNNYHKLINNLLDIQQMVIKTTISHIDIYKAWQHKKVIECFNDQLEASIQAKLETYVWRLALVIEMTQQATTGHFQTNISNESIHKAIRLIEYFRYNALKVHDRILSKNYLQGLTPAQLDLYKALPYEFKRADVLPLFDEMGFSIRTADRFLKNEKIFNSFQTSKELKAGHYKKKFS
ncbi:YfjI family protein [Flavobacteriaceae bacterium F08102]|nr:YfjI family protein [Flavobacteriaceae bacterium F08102]